MVKKILKSKIFLVITTIILTAGTTVFGAIIYNANQIVYTPSDASWSVNSVDMSLNDIYSKTKNHTKVTETLIPGETSILAIKAAGVSGNGNSFSISCTNDVHGYVSYYGIYGDTTRIEKVSVTTNSIGGNTGGLLLFVGTTTPINDSCSNALSMVNIKAAGTYEMDVSEYDGVHFIGVAKTTGGQNRSSTDTLQNLQFTRVYE